MSEPAIFDIRVVRLAKVLPCHVALVLPGESIPQPPAPQTHYLTVELPDMAPYDECLGRFLRTWGKLEAALRDLFQALSDTDTARAQALSATLSGKALSDAIASLSGAILAEEEDKKLINLLERLSGLATKRNFIVHGYWIVEIIAYNNRAKDAVFKLEVMREYPVTSRVGSRDLSDPKNQKIRAKHLFRIKKIDEIAATSEAFRNDVASFIRETWPDRQIRPAEWT